MSLQSLSALLTVDGEKPNDLAMSFMVAASNLIFIDCVVEIDLSTYS